VVITTDVALFISLFMSIIGLSKLYVLPDCELEMADDEIEKGNIVKSEMASQYKTDTEPKSL
jgi:hypothetical protein